MSFLKNFEPETCSFIKKRLQTGVFWRVSEIFQNTDFVFDYSILRKKGVLKNPTKFTAKFMGAAASGISENEPCLAGCEVIDVLQN